MSLALPTPPTAVDWNRFFNLTGAVGLIALAIVVGAMVFFVYSGTRIKKEPIRHAHGPSRVREFVIFSSISVILLFSLVVASYRMTSELQFAPTSPDTLTIDVSAFQWSFRFTYPNNVTSMRDCAVPAGKQVIFNVTSADVMHNFGLPNFKLKIDAIPGRFNILWITTPQVNPNQQLTYQIRCYELCGTGHTYMIGKLIVMEETAFNQWLNNQTMAKLMAAGG